MITKGLIDKSQRWGFMSRSTARVMLGQVLNAEGSRSSVFVSELTQKVVATRLNDFISQVVSLIFICQYMGVFIPPGQNCSRSKKTYLHLWIQGR